MFRPDCLLSSFQMSAGLAHVSLSSSRLTPTPNGLPMTVDA